MMFVPFRFPSLTRAAVLIALLPLSSSLSVPSKSPTPGSETEYIDRLRAKIEGSIAKAQRRAEQRSFKRRTECVGCSRPDALCVCDALPKTKFTTKTKILILQHPNERRKKNVSTVPLIRMVLENVQVIVGHEFHYLRDILEHPNLKSTRWITEGQKPLLLYPSPDAISLDNYGSFFMKDSSSMNDMQVEENLEASLFTNENDYHDDDNKEFGTVLIVIDGTWSEAKRTVRVSPTLVKNCQVVKFMSEDSTSIYDALRKEPEAHCLSTLEACAKALLLLEDKKEEPSASSENAAKQISDCLHAVLKTHVDSHLSHNRLTGT